MKEKILTISIAAYNIEATIEEAMSSLTGVNDFLDKTEIIIVNDGSTDNTSALAHAFAQKYSDSVKVVDKKNGGYGSTINSSLAIAKGKYYKLLDGDDWFEKNNLLDFINFLDSSNADIVISPYYQVRDSKVDCIDKHNEINDKNNDITNTQFKETTFLMHEITVKTDTLRKVNRGIAENCFYTDSEYVFYALASSQDIARFSKPVYCYRLGVDGQSVSLTGIRKHYKDYFVVAQKMYEYYENIAPTINGGKRMILSTSVRNYTYHLYHAYILLENHKLARKEIISIDKFIKEKYPKSYVLGFNSKLVKTLRNSKFILFPLFARMKI